MASRAETRSAGRHRREQAGWHRAPRTLLTPLASERGRAVLLTTALSAALVTGVAGGTAAAATEKRAAPAGVVLTSPAPEPDEAAPVSAGPWKPPAAGVVSAAPAKLKPRVTLVLKAEVKTEAAWVNPNPSGRVTSCFGQRWGRLHAGVDIAGPHGSPILAAGDGVVVRAGEAQGYGNAVLIDHGDGYLTHYGHMSVIAVRVGQRVEAGEQIGDEGSTGHSTGPHLHFEVHQGFYKNPIEPVTWLHEHGVALAGCEPVPG